MAAICIVAVECQDSDPHKQAAFCSVLRTPFLLGSYLMPHFSLCRHCFLWLRICLGGWVVLLFFLLEMGYLGSFEFLLFFYLRQ